MTDGQSDVTPDVSLLLNSSAVEDLFDQLTSSPTTAVTAETIIQPDSQHAVPEILEGQTATSPTTMITVETVIQPDSELEQQPSRSPTAEVQPLQDQKAATRKRKRIPD